MSERGSFRGGGGGGGRGFRGGGGGERRGGHSTRGGGRGGGDGGGARGDRDRDRDQQQEKPKKENILDLTKYMDKEVIVKFNGGREGISPPLFPLQYYITLRIWANARSVFIQSMAF